jgi:hypothetical protein
LYWFEVHIFYRKNCSNLPSGVFTAFLALAVAGDCRNFISVNGFPLGLGNAGDTRGISFTPPAIGICLGIAGILIIARVSLGGATGLAFPFAAPNGRIILLVEKSIQSILFILLNKVGGNFFQTFPPKWHVLEFLLG